MKKISLIVVLLLLSLFTLVSCDKKVVTLNTPEITLNGDVVSWTAIENAENYNVFVNNNLKTSVTSTSYKITETEVGKYDIQVQAWNSDEEAFSVSSLSNTVTYEITKELSAPVLSLDGKTVTWNKINNANSYLVYVNGTKVATQADATYTLTEVKLGTYEIEVQATSNNEYYKTSEKSQKVTITIEKKPLATPVLSIKENVVSWTAIENAENYEVLVNGTKVATQTETSYTISETLVGEYKVVVRACNVTNELLENSAESQSVSYVIAAKALDTPVVSIDGSVMTWAKVENAESYEIYVNGNKLASTTELTYTLKAYQDGTFTAYIVAVTTSAQYSASSNSNTVEYKFVVDITKPVLLTIKSQAGKALTLVDGSSYADNLENIYIIGSEINLDNLSELYGDAVEFVPATFKQNDTAKNKSEIANGNKNWIDPAQGDFYYIRLANGKYLAFTNGDTVTGKQGCPLITAGVLDKENYNFLWQVVKTTNESEYLIRNVGGAMIYANAYNNGANCLCHKIEDNTCQLYPLIEGHAGFIFSFTQVEDAPMKEEETINLSGNYTIKSQYTKTYLKFDGNMVDGGTEVGEGCYVYTFEKVTVDGYVNTYRIKVGSQYLTYDKEGYMVVLPLDETNNGQIYVIEDAPGIKNAYRIANLKMGYFGDWFTATDRLVVFKYENINAWGQRQNILEWDYHAVINFYIESTTKDAVEYEEKLDLTKPVVMYVKSSSLLPTFDNTGLMIKGSAYQVAADNSASAMQIIAVGDYYKIKTVDGYYLEYNPNGDKFFKTYKSNSDKQLFHIDKASNAYIIKPVTNGGYVLCEDDNSGYHLYSDCNVDSQRWIIKNVKATIQADQIEELPGIFENPVIMVMKGDQTKALEFRTGNGDLDVYLGQGSTIDLNNLQALYASAFIFEEASFKENATGQNAIKVGENNTAWIKASEGKFYYIKCTDGLYLAALNGDLIGASGAWYTSKGVLDKENYMYLWQVYETETTGEYLIRNVGASMVFANAYNVRAHACLESDGRIHQYSLIPGHDGFIFKFISVPGAESSFKAATMSISGDYYIKGLATNTYLKFDTNMVDGGASVGTGNYRFTFVPVTVQGYVNTYRIMVGSQYLTYVQEGVMALANLDEADNGQIFILEDVPGLKNGYRIANIKMGYFGDWFIGLDRLVVMKYGQANAWGQRQNILEWDYGKDADFILEKAPEAGHTCAHVCPTCGKCTDATCTDPACAEKCKGHSIFDNPVLMFVKNDTTKVLEIKQGTGAVENYLAYGSTFDKNTLSSFYGAALQFIPATFKEETTGQNAIKIGQSNTSWLNPNAGNFYYIKCADGKYLAGVNGDLVGASGSWYVSSGYLDEENYMYMWQVIKTATDGEYLIRNVGVAMVLANAYNVPTYFCDACTQDGRMHFYSLIDGNYGFIFSFVSVPDATIAADAKMNLTGDYYIKSACTNTYLKFDTNMVDGGASVGTGNYRFTFVPVTVQGYVNTYRIMVGSQYLTYVQEGVMALANLDEADNGQIFIIEHVAGMNAYRIANVKMGYFGDWFTGLNRLVVMKYGQANAWGQRQNILEWDYGKDADFFFEKVVE